MSTITNNDIARAIYLASKDKGTEPSLFAKKVVQFLARRRLLPKWKDILSRLEKIKNEEEGRVVVKVGSKENLTGELKKELTDTLLKRYKAKEVVMVPYLDERLLGGFKVEVGDEIIDLTIKNKVRQLQEYLTS